MFMQLGDELRPEVDEYTQKTSVLAAVLVSQPSIPRFVGKVRKHFRHRLETIRKLGTVAARLNGEFAATIKRCP